jgi:hypothetical protein
MKQAIILLPLFYQGVNLSLKILTFNFDCISVWLYDMNLNFNPYSL